MPQKLNYESKKIQILVENGINSKIKHRKANNSILSRSTGDSRVILESGLYADGRLLGGGSGGGGGGGGLSYEMRAEILNKNPKGNQSEHGPTFFTIIIVMTLLYLHYLSTLSAKAVSMNAMTLFIFNHSSSCF